MKCKVKVGELRDALQMAAITVDRRQGSELGYVHLGSRKGKGGNQRIILNSTDGVGRFLIRVPCEVEETGDLNSRHLQGVPQLPHFHFALHAWLLRMGQPLPARS